MKSLGQFCDSPSATLAFSLDPVIGFIDRYRPVVVALRVAVDNHTSDEHGFYDANNRGFIPTADICCTGKGRPNFTIESAMKEDGIVE